MLCLTITEPMSSLSLFSRSPSSLTYDRCALFSERIEALTAFIDAIDPKTTSFSEASRSVTRFMHPEADPVSKVVRGRETIISYIVKTLLLLKYEEIPKAVDSLQVIKGFSPDGTQWSLSEREKKHWNKMFQSPSSRVSRGGVGVGRPPHLPVPAMPEGISAGSVSASSGGQSEFRRRAGMCIGFCLAREIFFIEKASAHQEGRPKSAMAYLAGTGEPGQSPLLETDFYPTRMDCVSFARAMLTEGFDPKEMLYPFYEPLGSLDIHSEASVKHAFSPRGLIINGDILGLSSESHAISSRYGCDPSKVMHYVVVVKKPDGGTTFVHKRGYVGYVFADNDLIRIASTYNAQSIVVFRDGKSAETSFFSEIRGMVERIDKEQPPGRPSLFKPAFD